MKPDIGRLMGGVLAGAAFFLGTAAPAWAFGPLTHGAAAQRTYAMLVARSPWLAPHRDAFMWGALAADVHEAPGAPHLTAARTQAAAVLRSMWREAQPAGAGPRAFVLGWATHAALEGEQAGWWDEHGPVVEAALAAAGTRPPEGPVADALVDLAVDAAIAPRTGNLLREMAEATWRHAGTPAGAPLMGIVSRVLGVDEGAYMALAGLTIAMDARGIDRYLAERARFVRVEPWLETARGAEVRGAIGDLNPLLARAAARALADIDRLVKEKT